MALWVVFVGRKNWYWREVQEQARCQTQSQFQGWGLLVPCLCGQKEELPAEPSLGGMTPRKECTRVQSHVYWRQHFFSWQFRIQLRLQNPVIWTRANPIWLRPGCNYVYEQCAPGGPILIYQFKDFLPDNTALKNLPPFPWACSRACFCVMTVSPSERLPTFSFISLTLLIRRLKISIIFQLHSLRLVTTLLLVVTMSSNLQAS